MTSKVNNQCQKSSVSFWIFFHKKDIGHFRKQSVDILMIGIWCSPIPIRYRRTFIVIECLYAIIKELYPHPKYLFGIGIWIWDLAYKCPWVEWQFQKKSTEAFMQMFMLLQFLFCGLVFLGWVYPWELGSGVQCTPRHGLYQRSFNSRTLEG